MPIPEITDSNKFKKVDAYSTIGNRNSIRLPYSGTRYFNDLVESKDKEILPHHTCGLIEMDSIVFARVYLSYSNFKDVTNWVIHHVPSFWIFDLSISMEDWVYLLIVTGKQIGRAHV